MSVTSEQQIRERAYQIWENEGRPEGRSDEHWRIAASEFAPAGNTQNSQPDKRARKTPNSQRASKVAPSPASLREAGISRTEAEAGKRPAEPSKAGRPRKAKGS